MQMSVQSISHPYASVAWSFGEQGDTGNGQGKARGLPSTASCVNLSQFSLPPPLRYIFLYFLIFS